MLFFLAFLLSIALLVKSIYDDEIVMIIISILLVMSTSILIVDTYGVNNDSK